ncbi:transcription antitermination factor NusB [Neokomagataea thailandica NBRC 106555]|uniref:Transcription antitermination protein NusB n=2 Tax=Neokomagataea TaxID=1223423 RepID=A0A4Y6VAZ8_9PROT|nr:MULTISPECIES: transcription antitermination factor NusB [Neokomagataea]QDH25696.1 transcription antitermination factor NusB [Neokomagataea tanensis]GBR54419.1 transcription antitermination factor NusB [Neokomagataea thailandica NBRC 106555]
MTNSPEQPARRSRTIARVAAVQALFQCEQSGDNAETVVDQFIRHRKITPGASFEDGHIPDADLKLFQDIVRTTTWNQDEIDKTIVAALPETWNITRLDPVLRALLRAGAYEILKTDVPGRVIINEYLDVAHGFFSGDEPRMVNGLLDTLNRNKAAANN